MDVRVIVDELDNVIARAEMEMSGHRLRINAMPPGSPRENDERQLRKMDLHLRKLRRYRSGLVVERSLGSLLHRQGRGFVTPQHF